jgi:hypothetical protein
MIFPRPPALVPSDVEPVDYLSMEIDTSLNFQVKQLTPHLCGDKHLTMVQVKHGGLAKIRPTDIVFVIDNSGSMRGSPIQRVKDTLNFTLDQLPPICRVGIVLFNSLAKVVYALTPMTDENKESCRRVINSIRTEGGTDILAGELMGIKMLKERHFFIPNAFILLLSDGEDGSGRSFSPDDHLLAEMPGCVTVNTLGYGEETSLHLKTISDRENGIFTYVRDQKFVTETFASILGGFLTVDYHNINIEVQGPVTRVYSEKKSDRKAIIPFIFGEGSREVLFEFGVNPDLPLSFDILINYQPLDKPRVTLETISVVIERSSGVVEENLEVDTVRNRFICSEAIEKSIRLGKDEALDTLRRAVDIISRSVSGHTEVGESLIRDLNAIITGREKTTVISREETIYQSAIAATHTTGITFDTSYRSPYLTTSSQRDMIYRSRI